jgi:cation:H+ antiporter
VTAVLFVVVGIVLLWGSAEFLVRGATILGTRAGLSAIVIGLTIVSIGTSAPEFVVSVAAALSGNPDLAVGNVLGSNLANIGLILGVTALIGPIQIQSRVVRREIPWMLAVTALMFPLTLNLSMGRVEGAVLASVLFLYLYYLFAYGGTEQVADLAMEAAEVGAQKVGIGKPIGMVALGVLGLVAGARAIVTGGTELAAIFAVPQIIIGLSVLAVGTSLPELATSVVAAMRGETDIAVGNVVGSNIFNLTFVLGGTALVRPIELDPSVLSSEYPAVVVLSVLLLPLAWARPRMGRREGLMLLGMYGLMWVWILRDTAS